LAQVAQVCAIMLDGAGRSLPLASEQDLHGNVASVASPVGEVKVHLLSGEEFVVPAECCSSAGSIRMAVSSMCDIYSPQLQLTLEGVLLTNECVVFAGADLHGYVLPADFQELVFTSFDEFALKEDLLRNVRAKFPTPYPAQQHCLMPLTLCQHVRMQGDIRTGKTTALAIAAIQRVDQSQRACQALILTAERETAMQIRDIVDSLSDRLDISSCMIIGGIEQRPVISAAREGRQIAIGTPGRVFGLISRRFLSLGSLTFFALDDIDKQVDRGFKDQILDVFAAMRPTVPQIVMSTSAELDPECMALLKQLPDAVNMLSIRL